MKNDMPKIAEFEDFRLIVWPAFTYIERTDGIPISIDEGGRDLGRPAPGVAVPFPTRRYGEQHKHFGICEGKDGNPLAYGLAVSISAHARPHEHLAAAREGQTVTYKGKPYKIRKTANDNIALDPA